MNQPLFFAALLAFGFAACRPTKNPAAAKDDGRIEVQILHINDVYEISPLENGRIGGMARVAQLRQELLKQNPNTLTIHAGDFLNPSVIGTLSYENQPIKGRHMVEVMNACGIEIATFGNHEFDLKEAELVQRIAESRFEYIVSNALQLKDGNGQPFQHNGKPIAPYTIRRFRDADGTEVRIGFIATMVSNYKVPYAVFTDPMQAARAARDRIKDSVDFVLGITHLDLEDDVKLGNLLADVPLLMGGHDHDNMRVAYQGGFVCKADANAKTAYVHVLTYDRATKKVAIESKLRQIDGSLADEPATAAVIKKWTDIAAKSFADQGFNPEAKVASLPYPLDAREKVVRNRPSLAAEIVARAMLHSAPSARAAIFNTGSIRIDDVLTGNMTEYDVIRFLPFGGKIAVADLKGALLRRVIQVGRRDNLGKGGYLALGNIQHDPASGTIAIDGQALDDAKVYSIALPEFLLSGKETNLDFLNNKNPEVLRVELPSTPSDLRQDLRRAVVSFLQKNPLPAEPCQWLRCDAGKTCKESACY